MASSVRVRIREKGQVTLPHELREAWGLKENDELEIIYDKVLGLMKPVKEMKVKETAGILGPADEDEVTFATLDSELLTYYYRKKYPR